MISNFILAKNNYKSVKEIIALIKKAENIGV